MIKKLIYFNIFFLLFIFFSNWEVNAKEYCNLFVNNELNATIELPFYFYKNTRVLSSGAYPTPQVTTSYTYIDSITKCEEIDVTVKNTIIPSNQLSTVYDYTKEEYDQSLPLSTIFNNSKFKNDSDTLKGYGSIEDVDPPYFINIHESYRTNINNPISLDTLLSSISAYDDRDGNLTDEIKITYDEYSSNLNNLGNHLIILSVEDSVPNKISYNIYIEIYDNDPPTIEGKNNYVSYVTNPINLNQITTNLQVKDNVNENLETELMVCEDNYTSNKNIVGTYKVFYCAYDLSNNKSTPYEITIEVKDDTIPLIEGLDYYTSKLSNPLTIQEIMYSLAASDNGKDISNSIFIQKDYYSNYLNTIGEKYIIFQAMDEHNNVSLPFKVTINLIDDISPRILGLNTFDSYLSNPLSITYLKQQLVALDNYDGDISHNIEITLDSYSNNITRKGTFYLTLQVKDSSSNLSDPFQITINTIDDVSPYITGEIELNYEITNIPALDILLSQYKTNDNIDSNLSIELEKENFSQAKTTGTYYVQIYCIDSSNNKSPTFTIKINIEFIIIKTNRSSIYLPTDTLLNIKEINKIINFNENSYKIINNTYEQNYNKEGNYIIEYELEDSSILIINITTFTKQNEKQKKETFITKIKNFFKKFINYIKNIFFILPNIFQF